MSTVYNPMTTIEPTDMVSASRSTINGSTTLAVTATYSTVRILSTGTEWVIVTVYP